MLSKSSLLTRGAHVGPVQDDAAAVAVERAGDDRIQWQDDVHSVGRVYARRHLLGDALHHAKAVQPAQQAEAAPEGVQGR